MQARTPTARSSRARARSTRRATARSSPRCSACRCSRGRPRRRSRWATPTPATSATSTTSSRSTSRSRTREFDAVLRRNQGIPWVNTIAADSRGEAYYADISVVPNVTDEQAQTCNTALGHGDVRGAAAAGPRRLALGLRLGRRRRRGPARAPSGRASMPSLFRADYVTNSNDSLLADQPEAAARGLRRDHRRRAHRALAAHAPRADHGRRAGAFSLAQAAGRRSSTTASTRASCGATRRSRCAARRR